MALPRERELKLRLESRDDLAAVLAATDLGCLRESECQENHYFDSRSFRLLRRGALLRLRRSTRTGSEEQLTLTFKHGGESTGRPGYFDAVEVEERVSKALFDAALEDAKALLAHPSRPARLAREALGDERLTHVGQMQTERRRLEAARYDVDLDTVRLSDGTETYELEIETEDPDGASAWIEAELGRRGVRFAPERSTKLERLVASMGVELPGSDRRRKE